MLVTAATGAVGSVVGQLAKIAGARAIGVAGGPGEMHLRDRDARLRRLRRPQIGALRRRAEGGGGQGIDGVFENVGGEPFLQALRRLNDFARIAVCGLIASYEGPTTPLPDMRIFLVRRIKVEGFIASPTI